MKKRWKGLLALCMAVVMLTGMSGVAQAAAPYTVTVPDGASTRDITLTDTDHTGGYTLTTANHEKWVLYAEYDYGSTNGLESAHVSSMADVWNALEYWTNIYSYSYRNIWIVNEEGKVMLADSEPSDLDEFDELYRNASQKNLTFSGYESDDTADLPTIPHYNVTEWKIWKVDDSGHLSDASLTDNKITRGDYDFYWSNSVRGLMLTATGTPITYTVPVKDINGTAGTSLTFTLNTYSAVILPAKTNAAYKWQFTYDTTQVDVTGITDIWNVIDALVQGGGTYDSSKALLQEVCPHANTEVRGAVAATCEGAGYTGDTYCLVCGEKISTGTSTDALGHDYDEGVITRQPTVDTEGEKTFTCNRDSSHTYTEPIAKLPAPGEEPTPTPAPTETPTPTEAPVVLDNSDNGTSDFVRVEAPQTGEETNVFLWFILFSAVGVEAVLLCKRKQVFKKN